MPQIVITSSVLILVIAAVRHFLRGKLSMRLQYSLWLLVAVRLLVPVSLPASPISVLNAAPAAGEMESLYLAPQQVVYTPPEGSPGPVLQYDGDPPLRLGPATRDNTLTYVDGSDVTHKVEYERQIDLSALLRPVWYAGMAVMAGWFLWVNRSFRKKLRSARRLTVPDCPLPVYVAEGIPSPCMVGILRPAVYVTPACAGDGDRLRHVLAHELTHWRSGDALWSLVRCLCLSIYWFNPLVWLAASLSRRDCELACDEGALKRLGEEERTAYGRTLIGLIARSSSPAYLLQTATTMADGKGGLKERLTLIAKKPRVLAAAAVLAVGIAAVAAACTFTGAVSLAGPEAGSVEEALAADLPAELTPTEDAPLDGVVTYTPGDNSGFLALEEGELLRGYRRVHMTLSSNLERPLGWLASVCRMDQETYDTLVADIEQQRRADVNEYWQRFARDEDYYYLIHAPISAPELRAGETQGAELQAKLVEWMKTAVLGVDGVEAFDGERVEYVYRPDPADDPVDDPASGAYPTAAAAYQALVNDDPNALAEGDLERAWANLHLPWTVLEYTMMDLDGDGENELLVQYRGNDPSGTNAVFHYDVLSGKVRCWHFDYTDGNEFQYPLKNGDMVYESRLGDDYISYTLFRYNAQGEKQETESVSRTPEGWQHDDKDITQAEFQRLVEEKITSQKLDASAWTALTAQTEPPTPPADAGRTVVFEYQDLKLEITNVCDTRVDYHNDSGMGPFPYDVYVVYPGATVTVLETEGWVFYTEDGRAIRIKEVTEPVRLVPGSGGITGVGTESVFILGFEFYGGDIAPVDAFQKALSGITSVLAYGYDESYWAESFPKEDLVYLLMDVDGDGEVELLLQHKDGPEGANAVLDCRNGLVYVQRADCVDGSEFVYPLRDGTMVYEYHSGDRYSYSLFRHTPGCWTESLECFTYTPAGGWTGETDEPERWQYSNERSDYDWIYKDVTRAEFERLVEEKITSQRVDASMWKELGT